MTITHPAAVRFDPAAALAWLTSPISAESATTNGDVFGVDDAIHAGSADFATAVDDVLGSAALFAAAFTMRSDVTSIALAQEIDGGYPTGGVWIVVGLTDLDGFNVASDHLASTDLVGPHFGTVIGPAAVVAALQVITDTVNTMVADVRASFVSLVGAAMAVVDAAGRWCDLAAGAGEAGLLQRQALDDQEQVLNAAVAAFRQLRPTPDPV